MIFVSIPYSSPYVEIVEERVKALSIYCAQLLAKGVIPTSPVLFGSTVLKHYNLPSDFGYWSVLSLEYVEHSEEVHVLLLDGWKESTGVRNEIEKARELKIPIKYINVFKSDNHSYFFSENADHGKKEGLLETLLSLKKAIDAEHDDDDVKLRFT
jgi:hypothetical protein